MSRLKRFFEYLLVYLLGFGWFALFQPWGAFNDPDGFTHGKIASLIMQRGFLQDFPWLDLTILHTYFVDQHLGLHLLQIPFIKLFGMLPGAQLSAVTFAGLVVLVFYACARWVGSQKPWLWTLLLVTATPFVVRMSLAKSSPLAVSCFLIGLSALVCVKKRPAFLAGLFFSLMHGGWLLLLVSEGLVAGAMLGWQGLRHLVGRVQSITHLPESLWRKTLVILATTTVGCAGGILLHPNAKNLFQFLWVQVVVIGVQTPFDRVRLGEEWRSITVGQLLVSIPLFILLAGLVLMAFRRRRGEAATEVPKITPPKPLGPKIFLPLVTIFLGLLTLKSKRYGEYFIPTLALTGAVFEAELGLHWVNLRTSWQTVGRRTRVSIIAVAALLLFSAGVDLRDTFSSLHTHNIPFTYVEEPMKAITAVATPGERVFHPQWDLFPPLFVANDQLRYVSGMDPTYLFVASTTRSDIYADFVFDQASSTDVYAFAHENLGANYIIFERERNPKLEDRLKIDERFTRLYQDAAFAVYVVKKNAEKR